MKKTSITTKNDKSYISTGISSEKMLPAKKKAVRTPDTVSNFDTLSSEIDQLPIDRESIPQERLDLVTRSRRSLFPWRGQFSPELIAVLLAKYVRTGSVVLDPFAGSGTTLFEAARKSLTCYGAEINPAAVEMASTAHFVNIAIAERKEYIHKAHTIIERNLPIHHGLDLFSPFSRGGGNYKPLGNLCQNMLSEASEAPLVHNIIANTIIRYMAVSNKEDARVFFDAFNQHKNIVLQLPYSKNICKVFQCDTRNIQLANKSIDMIVTSPPYINVFNYHQNSRKAMELMGWNLLNVAKSEFGSNRKNRGNRFLTVAQYAIDMLQALREMHRLIRQAGRIIVVIGKESQVRSVSFQNGRMLTALAVGGAGLYLALRQERKFRNKFGKTIYEDILHFVPAGKALHASDDFARSLAQSVLNKAINNTKDVTVREDILAASQQATTVKASPLFGHLSPKV